MGQATESEIAPRVAESPSAHADQEQPHREDIPRAGARLDAIGLGVLYAVSLLSLAGFATFTLHPERLVRAGVSAGTYGRILVLAPRAQIVLSVAVLALFLARHARSRWVAGFLAVYLISLGAELAGTTAGIPFGPYGYTDGLGAKWFAHVPVLIPASWYMMALPSYAIAARRFRHRGHPSDRASAVGRIVLGSFILLSWDLALDPAMSFATRYWVWSADGPYYGMPVLNLFGWFVTGVVLMIVFAAMRSDRWVGELPTGWLAAFYGANLLLPLGMSVAAGLWGAVAATVAALGAAWWIARARRAPESVA